MQDLAALGKEGSHVSASIHRPGENIRVLMSRLRLALQTSQHPSECDGFFHGSTGRSRSQSLEVKRQVVLDRCTGLHRLDLESGTNIRQHRGTEGKRLGVVLLPALILGAEVEGAGVLQVWRKNHSLVAGLPGELNAKVPSVKSDEDEVQVL